MAKPRYTKPQQKSIAQERVEILFREAEDVFPQNRVLANRYISLARAIAMKVKLRIPLKLKRRFCKHCYHYLHPGVNSRVRTRAGKVVISCLDCKKFMRIPIGKNNGKK